MSPSFALPYVPEPYPDELLGSWISRIYLQNGNGAWRPFMEATGYGPKQQAPLLDLVSHDARLERLLAAFGTTYERTLTSMTTAPFWLSLAGSEEQRVPGAPGLSMPMNNGRVLKQLSGLGIGRPSGRGTNVWHCAKCVAHDIESGRQPYWRRSHQLPTVPYCTTHWLPLQNCCHACDMLTLPAAKNRRGVLQSRCACGTDLRAVAFPFFEIPHKIKELCILSTQTLTLNEITWNRHAVMDALRSKLSTERVYSRTSIASVLAEAFPFALANRYGICLSFPGTRRTIRLNAGPAQTSAPSIAALLVAAEISFPQLLAAIKEGSSRGKRDPLVKKFSFLHTQDNVDIARKVFLEKRSMTNRVPGQLGQVFWFLRFHDFDWLVAHSGNRTNLHRPVPTVEHDRVLLQRHLGDSTRPTTSRGIGPAITRATVRDHEWWANFKVARRRARIEARRTTNFELATTRRAAISEAIRTLIASQDRPVRVTYGLLGTKTGLTSGQVMLLVTKNSLLQSEFSEANATKVHRQLAWALRLLVSKNKAINSMSVFRTAGLPSTPKMKPFVQELVSKHISQLGVGSGK